MPATSSFRATTMPQSLLLPSSLTKRRRHAPPYCSATSSRADRKASFALNQGHVSSFKNSPELRIYSSNNGRKPSKPTKLRVAVDVDEGTTSSGMYFQAQSPLVLFLFWHF